MFPLESVLLPGGKISLNVFEPRYLLMMKTVLRCEKEFGVVLIERGSEVGGGDIRMNVGMLTRVVENYLSTSGTLLIKTVGVKRIKIQKWLPNTPYPLAKIVLFPDEDNSIVTSENWERLVKKMRRVLAFLTELGETVAPVNFKVSDDPGIGIFELAEIAPLSELDKQRILEGRGLSSRFTLLEEFLEEITTVTLSRFQRD